MVCSKVPVLRQVIHAFKAGGLSKEEEYALDAIFAALAITVIAKIAGLL